MGEVDFSILGDISFPSPTAGESSEEGEQVPATEPEPVEEPAPEPEVEPEKPETESEEEPVGQINYDEMTPREKALFDQLQKVTGENLLLTKPKQDEPAQVSAEKVVEALFNYLEGQDVDEVFSTAENINKLLNAVGARVEERAVLRAQEAIMKNLTGVFTQHMNRQMQMREDANQWFNANPDMKQCERLLVSLANEIGNEKPELTVRQVLDESAKRIRTMMKIRNGTTPKTSKPAFVGAQRGGGRVKVPELQGRERDISDLLDL